MNRLIWIGLIFLFMGCQGKVEKPEVVKREVPVDPVPVPNPWKEGESQWQKILDWDFSQWQRVTEKPLPYDKAFFGLCDVATYYDVMRLLEEGKPEEEKIDFGPHEHFGFIQKRVNPTGIKAYLEKQPVSVGTVVIKEKFKNFNYLRSTDFFFQHAIYPDSVAAMIKREPGFDPENGDWEYAYQVNKPVENRTIVRGKIGSCIDCHRNVKDQDYLFRKYLMKDAGKK